MDQNPTCSICQRISLWRDGKNPHFIHEFEHSILVVGDHQFHKGYCLLLLKDHVRELHELESFILSALFTELMQAAQGLVETFKPWKMNYSCYGNQDPHIHWHLFPRYDSEPDHLNHPWLHASEFRDHLIDKETALQLAQRINANLNL
ncbi:MAG TPA: HIT family protein [Pyrinomonadaceae bacterium]|nr:HIT family protein [Pyrinomonadaceae bacterium]